MNITMTKNDIKDYDILSEVIKKIKEKKEQCIYISLPINSICYKERLKKIYDYLTIIFFEHVITYHEIVVNDKYIFRIKVRYYERAYGSNKKIADIASKKVERLVNSINKHTNSVIEELNYINEFFVTNFSYDDKSYKCYKALGPLINKKAVCSGFVLLFGLIAEKLNLEYIPVITINKEHIYVAVKINDTLKFIDFSENIAYKRLNKCFLKDNYYCGIDIDTLFLQKAIILKYSDKEDTFLKDTMLDVINY